MGFCQWGVRVLKAAAEDLAEKRRINDCKPRRGAASSRAGHRLSGTYGTARKPCPFKGSNAGKFSVNCEAELTRGT